MSDKWHSHQIPFHKGAPVAGNMKESGLSVSASSSLQNCIEPLLCMYDFVKDRYRNNIQMTDVANVVDT